MTEKDVRYVVADSHRYAARLVGVSGGWLTESDAKRNEVREPDGWKVYRVTVEEIESPQEQPQWWRWDDAFGWSKTGPAIVGEGVQRNTAHYGYNCVIHGTTADREAKRNALLAAAKDAGKGDTR